MGGFNKLKEDEDQRAFILVTFLHTADLYTPIKPFHISKKWAQKLQKEFNTQVCPCQSLPCGLRPPVSLGPRCALLPGGPRREAGTTVAAIHEGARRAGAGQGRGWLHYLCHPTLVRAGPKATVPCHVLSPRPLPPGIPTLFSCWVMRCGGNRYVQLCKAFPKVDFLMDNIGTQSQPSQLLGRVGERRLGCGLDALTDAAPATRAQLGHVEVHCGEPRIVSPALMHSAPTGGLSLQAAAALPMSPPPPSFSRCCLLCPAPSSVCLYTVFVFLSPIVPCCSFAVFNGHTTHGW
jgi:hypothetical protein